MSSLTESEKSVAKRDIEKTTKEADGSDDKVSEVNSKLGLSRILVSFRVGK